MWGLVAQFWALFHRLWGQAATGQYNKRDWCAFQDLSHRLFRWAGIEPLPPGIADALLNSGGTAMDETKGPDDVRNQPADQKLIDTHPELQDASTVGRVPGPQHPVAGATAPPPPTSPVAPSERPPAASPSQVQGEPRSSVPAPNDSHSTPRPHGQAGSDGERSGTSAARQQEATRRTEEIRNAGGSPAGGTGRDQGVARAKRAPLAGRKGGVE